MQRLQISRRAWGNWHRQTIEPTQKRLSSGGPGAQEEIPDPPSTFATVAAMGGGAFGAVAVAAVGVYGVFKMAFWVASETGRSINATDASTSKDSMQSAAQQSQSKEDVQVAAPLSERTPAAQQPR